MSLNLTNLLGRLFRRSAQTPIRRPRLGLEPLEAREVPAVVFTISAFADASEGSPAGAFRLTRTEDLSEELIVVLSVSGTATFGSDFMYSASPPAPSLAVFFDPDQTTADIFVGEVDDTIPESTETITLTIVPNPGIGPYSGYVIGAASSATINLLDNDNPVATVATVAVTASDTFEGSATGGFSFTRTGGDLSSSLTVTYAVSGTATSNTDYTALSGSVTFAAGADRVEVPVQALGDNLADDGETVIATLTGAGSTYTIDSGANSATVTIADQPLTVSVLRLSDGEEGASNGTFRFTRAGDISSSLTVAYTVAGTATAGTDYTALSGSVTFAANSDQTDVTVAVTDDVLVEPTETVTVTLVPNANYTFGNDADTVFLRDNDTRRVYWVSSGSTDWAVGANWSINSVPIATDDMYFSGSYSNVYVSALGSGLSSLAFAGVHFVDGYSGTVTLAVPLTAGTYEQTTGTLDQGVRVVDDTELPNDLTATGAFLWTGGTLNTLDNGAQVIIDGAAGVIDAPDDTALSLATASTLNVVGGSVVTLLSGTLEFTGGSGMSIDAKVKGVPGDVNLDLNIQHVASLTPVIEIKKNGTFGILKANKAKWGRYVSNVPILNKGRVEIDSGVQVEVSGSLGNNGPSIKQENGVTVWWSGANIKTNSGMTITGGNLEIWLLKPNTEVVLDGNLVFDSPDGSIKFVRLAGEGKLRVQGNVTWTSGTYEPTADGRNALASSLWDATGTFTVGNAAVVDADVRFADPAQGTKWKILGGAQGVNATAPALVAGLTDDFEMVAEGGTPQARRYWSLRRK